MGVGGDNSWGALAHEPYLIYCGKWNAIDYGFTIVPFDKKTDFKSLITSENRRSTYAFLGAQAFNVVFTLLVAWILFGLIA